MCTLAPVSPTKSYGFLIVKTLSLLIVTGLIRVWVRFYAAASSRIRDYFSYSFCKLCGGIETTEFFYPLQSCSRRPLPLVSNVCPFCCVRLDKYESSGHFSCETSRQYVINCAGGEHLRACAWLEKAACIVGRCIFERSDVGRSGL